MHSRAKTLMIMSSESTSIVSRRLRSCLRYCRHFLQRSCQRAESASVFLGVSSIDSRLPVNVCTPPDLIADVCPQTRRGDVVDLAAFVGLNCTTHEADIVLHRHTYLNPPGDYTTYGISMLTLEWMNLTMAKILPETILGRYGLTPVYI